MRLPSFVGSTMSLSLLLLAACSGGGNGGENAAAATETATASEGPAPNTGAMPKAGLWEMKVTAAGMPQAQATKVCLGETAAGANPFTPPTAGQNCSKNSVTKTATGYDIAMECTANGMTVASNGTVSGDLTSAYKVEMKTKMGGANLPAAAQQEIKTIIDAKYLGDCPADLKPGQTQS